MATAATRTRLAVPATSLMGIAGRRPSVALGARTASRPESMRDGPTGRGQARDELSRRRPVLRHVRGIDPVRRGRMLARLDPRGRHRQGRLRDPARRRARGARARSEGRASPGPGSPGARRPLSTSWPGSSASSRHRPAVSISRSTRAGPPSSSASGKRCARFRQARRRATPMSPSGSAPRRPGGRWRRACAANPLAVAIPCHRLVRTGGALSGYRWGVERKRALLAREAGS